MSSANLETFHFIIFALHPLSSPAGTLKTWILDFLFCSTGPWNSVHLFSHSYYLCHSDCINSTDLSSTSLILSSASSVLLLRPSSELLILVMVFGSSSHHLFLAWELCFSICFTSIWASLFKYLYTRCFKVCQIIPTSRLSHISIHCLFPCKLKFSWFFLCWVILDCTMNILDITLQDSGSSGEC